MRRDPLDDGAISLTAGFPSADETGWRALVDKTLNGAAFEKRLVSLTYDGIEILPLYTAANAAAPLAESLRGRAPFDADRAWDIRVVVDHPNPARANALLLTELEGGATSLLVKIDPSGRNGVAVGSEGDLEAALDGVLFDLAPVALDAGYLGPEAAGWLSRIAETRTLKPHLHLHLDPLGAFAECGVSDGPIQARIDAAAHAAVRMTADSAFLASGRAVHEAGGTEAQEVAVMAASGLAYVKAAVAAGMTAEASLNAVVLGLVADADYFRTIAKHRAAKLVWAKLANAISGAPCAIRIETRSSRRMLSALDPWVNMLRLTSAAFGASLGGADAVALDPFTQPIGRPTPFARRQARNIQLVLMEEAHLGRTTDPAGGAWFVDTLTDRIARAAWTIFQAIEAKGGAVPAFTSGMIADAVHRAREGRAGDVAKRKLGLVGVSEFPSLSESDVEIDPVDPVPFAKSFHLAQSPGEDDACPSLHPVRDSDGFERLRARARSMLPPPAAVLATLGAPKDYTGRVGFSQNLLAAGGIACTVAEAGGGVIDAPLVVLCGSDAGYADGGAQAVSALKAGGARSVYLAGRPGDLEPALNGAGIDGFLFAGMDIEAALAKLLDLMAGDKIA